jgi:hypothetical protein
LWPWNIPAVIRQSIPSADIKNFWSHDPTLPTSGNAVTCHIEQSFSVKLQRLQWAYLCLVHNFFNAIHSIEIPHAVIISSPTLTALKWRWNIKLKIAKPIPQPIIASHPQMSGPIVYR